MLFQGSCFDLAFSNWQSPHSWWLLVRTEQTLRSVWNLEDSHEHCNCSNHCYLKEASLDALAGDFPNKHLARHFISGITHLSRVKLSTWLLPRLNQSSLLFKFSRSVALLAIIASLWRHWLYSAECFALLRMSEAIDLKEVYTENIWGSALQLIYFLSIAWHIMFTSKSR